MPTVFRDKHPKQNTFLGALLHRLLELWLPEPTPALQQVRTDLSPMDAVHHLRLQKQTNLKP